MLGRVWGFGLRGRVRVIERFVERLIEIMIPRARDGERGRWWKGGGNGTFSLPLCSRHHRARRFIPELVVALSNVKVPFLPSSRRIANADFCGSIRTLCTRWGSIDM